MPCAALDPTGAVSRWERLGNDRRPRARRPDDGYAEWRLTVVLAPWVFRPTSMFAHGIDAGLYSTNVGDDSEMIVETPNKPGRLYIYGLGSLAFEPSLLST